MATILNQKIAKFLKMLREQNATQELGTTLEFQNKKTALVRYWGYEKYDLDEIFEKASFYLSVTSVDSKIKYNILSFVWFETGQKKEFHDDLIKKNFKIKTFLNPFEFTLPILVSNLISLFGPDLYWSWSEEVKLPHKYIQACLNWEYDIIAPFPTLDLDDFAHLYFLRNKKKSRKTKITGGHSSEKTENNSEIAKYKSD
jgi:hypothetical protein